MLGSCGLSLAFSKDEPTSKHGKSSELWLTTSALGCARLSISILWRSRDRRLVSLPSGACRSPKEMVCGEAKSQRNHSWLREVFVAPARPSIRIIPGVAVLMKRRSYAGARKNRHGSERIAMPHQQQQVTTKGWLERKERIQPTVVTNRLAEESFHWSSWDSRTCYPRRAFIQGLTDD